MGGNRKSVALLVVATTAVMQGAGSRAEPVRNEVPIRVYWEKAAGKATLSGVSVDDPNLGAVPFKLESDHFEGQRQAQGSWAFHDVTLFYSGEAAPLALRTRAGLPGIRIDVGLPSFTSCRREKLDALRAVSRNAPMQTRVNAMLAARHLLKLHSNACPSWARKDLAEIYFVMSCSLAKQTNFYRVSEEAKDIYRELARKPASAEDEITKCDAQTLGSAVKSLHDASRSALAAGNFASFAALNTELRDQALDGAWASGYAVQGLDVDVLRADYLKALYDQQQIAVSRRQLDTAVEYNQQLNELLAQSGYEEAFRRASLNAMRIEQDRAFIESLKSEAPKTEE